jgi:hypothetical protein
MELVKQSPRILRGRRGYAIFRRLAGVAGGLQNILGHTTSQGRTSRE